MENIQHSSKTNVETTRVINGAVSGLTRQVGVLEHEMAGFKYRQKGERSREAAHRRSSESTPSPS